MLMARIQKHDENSGLGLMTSLGIEILQIFTFRATDINDLITNAAGTLAGYLIGRVMIKMIPQLDRLNCRRSELYLLYGTVGAVMFFFSAIYFFIIRGLISVKAGIHSFLLL